MKSTLHLTEFDSPIGKMTIGTLDDGLAILHFGEPASLKIVDHFEISIEGNSYSSQTQQELQEYFDGRRKEFSVALNPSGTEFQKEVWKTLLKIPFGKTISYEQQSRAMNNPLAIRAIAHANGANPIAVIIPCHRVIGKDGSLTGYAGGLPKKEWLLRHESLWVQGELKF